MKSAWRSLRRALRLDIEDFMFWIAELFCRHNSTEEVKQIEVRNGYRFEKTVSKFCSKCGKDMLKK